MAGLFVGVGLAATKYAEQTRKAAEAAGAAAKTAYAALESALKKSS